MSSKVYSSRLIYFVLSILFFSCSIVVKSQDSIPLAIKTSYFKQGDTSIILTINFTISPSVRLFPLNKGDDILYSTLEFDSASAKRLVGVTQESGNRHTAQYVDLGGDVSFFTDSAKWQQTFSINKADSFFLSGKLVFSYQVGNEYFTREQSVKLNIYPDQTENNTGDSVLDTSLLWIFLASFAGGLLALLTPCVYSMIPLTVSFFTKRSLTRSDGIKNAVIYALSIVIIFTLFGFLITVFFGPAALNNLSTNWIANIVFFLLFFLFGLSFLGAFEIKLPNKWTTKVDTKAGVGSMIGIFFMALTLVLVSFSCTGPIIGNLLVIAAKGSVFGPLVGMFGFSLALAMPFAVFAFFPSKLNIMGKAGGWLNVIKVSLGFIELALALKFLSNADLAKGWRLLDREVFLVLWIVLFALLGFYLLGKLRFKLDSSLANNDFGLPYLSVTRLMLAIFSLAFSIYMLPGLFGAPLKAISAFVPPMGTQDFNINGITTESKANRTEVNLERFPKRYVEQMKIYEPEVITKYGLTVYYDYDEAIAVAKEMNKPIMLDFTGINCVNCRKMEAEVWSDPSVLKLLKEDFIIVSLYVDVHNIMLPESEHYFSTEINKDIETLGDKNADLQVKEFASNSQPYYFFIDSNGRRLVNKGYGYDSDIQKFIRHLNQVKKVFSK